MLHLRLISPTDRTDAVCSLLAETVGVTNVIVLADAALSRAARQAQVDAPGEGVDAVVWQQVEERTSEESTLSVTFLVFLSIATLIAGVGVFARPADTLGSPAGDQHLRNGDRRHVDTSRAAVAAPAHGTGVIAFGS